MSESKSIAIIGGGAAGFFCAIAAAERARESGVAVDIKLLEASGKYLQKVKISGGGRCNVTHHLFDPRRFCEHYPRGQKALLSPFQRFQARDTVEWFRRKGVELVAEEDGRMFPATNTSETIIDCYLGLAEQHGIELLPRHGVESIDRHSSGRVSLTVRNRNEPLVADAVLLATGSAASGYRLAEGTGHTITERAPSLFSFRIADELLADLQGLSFDASVTLTLPDRKKFKQAGPLLITHWGLSGPAILKLSAWAAREMKRADYRAQLHVNWMGTASQADVDETLARLKDANPKSLLRNAHPQALPKRFWLSLLARLGVESDKQWANVSRKELKLVVQGLTASPLAVSGQNRFKEEFVECGGVCLKQVDFKTMESRIFPGLYFAGEVLDVDGVTGGFNFQNAWTTGWIAAQSMVDAFEAFEKGPGTPWPTG